MEVNESYRACVCAIIFNRKKEFLFVKLNESREDEWDFTKGGVMMGESFEKALEREIKEELGNCIKCKIVQKTEWSIVYEWLKPIQIKKGYLGQARVNYLVLFEEGDIIVNHKELSNFKWVKEKDVIPLMLQSGFPEFHSKAFYDVWADFKSKNKCLFA